MWNFNVFACYISKVVANHPMPWRVEDNPIMNSNCYSTIQTLEVMNFFWLFIMISRNLQTRCLFSKFGHKILKKKSECTWGCKKFYVSIRKAPDLLKITKYLLRRNTGLCALFWNLYCLVMKFWYKYKKTRSLQENRWQKSILGTKCRFGTLEDIKVNVKI